MAEQGQELREVAFNMRMRASERAKWIAAAQKLDIPLAELVRRAVREFLAK